MAEDVVFLLYGDGWTKSALLIMILAPIGPAMVMTSSLGDAVISAGYPRLILRARTLDTVFLVVALFGTLQFGFETMVLVFSAAYYVFMLPLHFAAAKRVLPLRIKLYLTQQVPVVVATVALIVTVYLAHSTVSIAISHHWAGILTASLGTVVYLAALAIMDRKILLDLRQILFGVTAR
jgi:O-antigen/teichoic acid export membrane protein